MDIILVKSILATLAFTLAALNLLIMAQLYGKLHLFPLVPQTLSRWHRRQGDVILSRCSRLSEQILFGRTQQH